MKKKTSKIQMVTEPKYKPEELHAFIYGRIDAPSDKAEARKALRAKPIRDVIKDIQEGKRFDANPSVAPRKRYADPKTLLQASVAEESRDEWVPLTEEDDLEE